jgi:hypothetical protein
MPCIATQSQDLNVLVGNHLYEKHVLSNHVDATDFDDGGNWNCNNTFNCLLQSTVKNSFSLFLFRWSTAWFKLWHVTQKRYQTGALDGPINKHRCFRSLLATFHFQCPLTTGIFLAILHGTWIKNNVVNLIQLCCPAMTTISVPAATGECTCTLRLR